MSPERLLQICVATLAVLGTVMFSMGQRYVGLPILALIVSFSSVYLTDIKGWLRLNTTVANIAGVVAVLFAVSDLRHLGEETRLLALANMLVYLQFVLLYRKKTVRIYWLLITLSLLQTAVATALNFDVNFGVILFVYTVFGVTALVLLFFHSEAVRFAVEQTADVHEGNAAVSREGVDRPTAWPLDLNQSELKGRIHDDSADNALDRKLVFFLAKTIVVTIVMTGFIFFAVPRLERAALTGPTVAQQHVAGASEQVELGALGEIIANPEAVMRVEFYDENGNSLHLQNEPLLRGVVFLEYENGAWQQDRRSDQTTFETEQQTVLAGGVRQRITIEPLDVNVLYAVYPVASIHPVLDVQFDERRRQLTRADAVRHTRFTYELLTLGIEHDRIRSVYPSSERVDFSRRNNRLMSMRNNDALEARLAQLAREQLAAAGIPDDDRYAQARALESFLRNPENFTYSLELPRRNPALDPIEQYLFETRQGHCEYSATALALLLRSVGIESRLVVGFKGGEWNRLGRFYQVRQWHAHAWVEAYLPPDQVPSEMKRLYGNWEDGAWLVLDPTPTSARAQQVEAMRGRFVIFRQISDYAAFLWSSYIIGMTATRQQEIIYAPLVDGAASLLRTVLDRNSWEQGWQTTTKFLRFQWQEWRRGELFSWRAGLAFIVVCLVLLSLFLATRFLVRRLIRWVTSRSAAARRHQGRQVAFYRRLEKILARRGVRRTSGQTQREFARTLTLSLADSDATLGVSRLASRVVDSFYRVRFGGHELDPGEQASVEQALTQLESALAVAGKRSNRSSANRGSSQPTKPR